MEYILNLVKSPEDNRDHIFLSNNSTEKPVIVDHRLELQPIRDQGKQGTCYAQSSACMKEWQEKKDYGFDEYLSPQFFYDQRMNKYDENDNNDYGMFGRDVMKLLKNVGICKETDYPYGNIKHRDDISQDIYNKAKNHCIESYARINDMDSLKFALYKYGPCLIGVPVWNFGPEMWKRNNGDVNSYGGHAMTVVGYNDDEEHFIIRNSWGERWGDKGYGYYKYKDWGCHWEIWSTIDDTTDIDNIEPEIPEPNEDTSVRNCLQWILDKLRGR